jgi:hypothetical protein
LQARPCTATERRRYNKDIGDFKSPLFGLESRMRKSLFVLALLIVSLTHAVAKESEDSVAIIAATKSYVSANSGLTRSP